MGDRKYSGLMGRMKWGIVFVALWILFSLPLLAANNPTQESVPINYARSLGQVDVVTTQIDAANTECLTNTGGGSVCEVFAMGSVNPVTPSGVGTCCWSQRRTGVTIGAQSAETAGVITVSAVGATCAGWTFAANQTHDMIPYADNLRGKGTNTYLGRYCSIPKRGAGGDLVYVPCGAGVDQAANNTECVTMTRAGSVCLAATDTRNTTIENERTASTYMHCRPGADDTNFAVATER
jgi:hypothetical protein